MRGGGGNFGVVTAFEYRLHEVGPQVYVAQACFPYADAREVLHFYRDLTSTLPSETACRGWL